MQVLGDHEIDRFVADGFVRLEAAFPPAVAASCVDELWATVGADRADRTTWTEPVVRVAGSVAAPIVDAINTARLCRAIDQLLGAGRWERRRGYGTFPIRFPSELDPGDTGWHIDGSFEINDEPAPWCYGVDVWSRQRALLVLMLYSDVGPDDAPTRIRVGSHRDVAPTLVPYGRGGVSFVTASQCEAALARPVVTATGCAGDAYLCHPFLMHAASWPHRGEHPRFIGQPAILHRAGSEGYCYDRRDGDDYSPCERAVLDAVSATAREALRRSDC